MIDRSNECSRWYTSEHPEHKHEWKKSCCTYRRTALTKIYACTIGIHPVWDVPPGLQKMYLATCTEDQMEDWFALLDSEDDQNHKKALDLAQQTLR